MTSLFGWRLVVRDCSVAISPFALASLHFSTPFVSPASLSRRVSSCFYRHEKKCPDRAPNVEKKNGYFKNIFTPHQTYSHICLHPTYTQQHITFSCVMPCRPRPHRPSPVNTFVPECLICDGAVNRRKMTPSYSSDERESGII